MKRLIIFALSVLSASDLFSQISKGDFLFSAEGSYMKSASENGVTRNLSASKGKYLDIGASAGFFFTERMVFGIGLNYNWGKESRRTTVMINRYIQYELMDIKTEAIMPEIFLGYYYPVVNKLYFSPVFRLRYGEVESGYKTVIIGAVDYQSEESGIKWDSIGDMYPSTYLIESEKNIYVELFSLEITPELTYFISSKFCLSLSLGGAGYSLADWKSDQSDWNINFNPAYWRFGIKIRI